jgi:hypothetical protein
MYFRKRVTGEEWLFGEPGAYLPGIYEKVIIVAIILFVFLL